MDIITIFKNEWPVISQALWSVATIVIVVFATAFAIGRFLSGEKISNMQSRLDRRDDEIASYKDKLNGATPDEVKGKIAALEAQLKAMRPPSLTAEQIDAARAVLLKARPAGVRFAMDTAGIDNSRIPAQLKAIFQEAKWPVIDALLFDMSHPTPSGVALFMGVNSTFLPQSVVIKNVLDATGIAYSIFKFPDERQDQMPELCFTQAAS